MSTAKDTLAFFYREMKVLRANAKANIIGAIALPFIILLLFGNMGATYTNVPIAVVNYANNQQARSFINDVQTNSQNIIDIIAFTNEETALRMLQRGAVDTVVVILPNFPSSNPQYPGVDLYYSNLQPALAITAVTEISRIAEAFGPLATGTCSFNQLSGEPGLCSANRNSGQSAAAPLFAVRGTFLSSINSGLIPLVVLLGTLPIGLAFLTDRQSGNVKTYLMAPVNKNAIVLSRLLLGAMWSIVLAVLSVLIGLALGMQVAMWLPMALVYITAGAILLGIGFSALGLVIATKIKKVGSYATFSYVIGFPLWFIGGGLVPLSFFPSWIVAIAQANPFTYATNIFLAIIMQGGMELPDLAVNMAALAIFAIAMSLLACRSFKPTID